MAVNNGEIAIYGVLVNDTSEGRIAKCQQIYDETTNKKQSEINKELSDKIISLENNSGTSGRPDSMTLIGTSYLDSVVIGSITKKGTNTKVAIGEQVNIEDSVSIANNIIIGENTNIGADVRLGEVVVIGDNTHIGTDNIIGQNVCIEDNTVIGQNRNNDSQYNYSNAVCIGPRVYIGTEAPENAISDAVKISQFVSLSTDVHIDFDTNIGNGNYIENANTIGNNNTIGDNNNIGNNVNINNFTYLGVRAIENVDNSAIVIGSSVRIKSVVNIGANFNTKDNVYLGITPPSDIVSDFIAIGHRVKIHDDVRLGIDKTNLPETGIYIGTGVNIGYSSVIGTSVYIADRHYAGTNSNIYNNTIIGTNIDLQLSDDETELILTIGNNQYKLTKEPY